MVAHGTHHGTPRLSPSQAEALLAAHLASYRRLSYAELERRIANSRTDSNYPEVVHGQTSAGAEYTIKTIIVWDASAGGHIRVMADLTAHPQICLMGFIPIYVPDAVDSFIRAPNGAFVGE
jgi:hypothetical protein